jgi:hypothetical protein
MALVPVMTVTTGCSSPAPGVRQSPFYTSTTVAAEPPQVAQVAEDVLRDLDLQNITATSTAIDGLVTGQTAQGSSVKVNITSAGARTSKVSVNNSAGSGVALQVVQSIEEKLADK